MPEEEAIVCSVCGAPNPKFRNCPGGQGNHHYCEKCAPFPLDPLIQRALEDMQTRTCVYCGASPTISANPFTSNAPKAPMCPACYQEHSKRLLRKLHDHDLEALPPAQQRQALQDATAEVDRAMRERASRPSTQ